MFELIAQPVDRKLNRVVALIGIELVHDTGAMFVGPCTALFMDEISTGLDSSTTFNIVRTLGQFCHTLDSTVVTSLLQPAPKTFDLFDDIILLSAGQCV